VRGLHPPAEQRLGLAMALVVLAEVPEAGQRFLQLRFVRHLEGIEAAALFGPGSVVRFFKPVHGEMVIY
jgi:hypothetical protein